MSGLPEAGQRPGVLVLTNVLDLEGNPYLRLWNAATRSSGARLAALSKTTARGRGQDRPSWVHIQWPERVLRDRHVRKASRELLRLFALVGLARARGARVLVTAHNVWSHDARHPALERILWVGLGLLTTDLHLMSEADAHDFLSSHPTFRRATRHVIPHGNYDPVVADAPERSGARAKLGLPLEARVFMTFGFLKSYKGVADLLDAFLELRDRDARLVVAGRGADEHLAHRLASARERDERLIVVPRFLSDAELACWIRASDRVVLPYRRILSSGSALLALTLARPVLVPLTPTFAALRERVGAEWVSVFEGRLGPSHLESTSHRNPAGRPNLEWCSWERVTEDLRALWNGSPTTPGFDGC